ncbi:hypothetical protein niasHS_010303 [Heterodera schachtii]|uniref:AN1-type domain-containing protein n=1 Tax=Heterodera schachtii TaxID=97005 RepID=A0ABD2IZC4_HETSC
MAEFPDSGKHCSVPDCRQLDYLPITCDACSRILCKQHRTYDAHSCTESYKKNVQFPICPLCQQTVPIKRGEKPDLRVNEHIERDCRSELAKKGRWAPKCGVKNCFRRELVPMVCKDCAVHFCLSHRHQSDHQCPKMPMVSHRTTKPKNVSSKSAAEQMDALFAAQLQREEYESSSRGGGGTFPPSSNNGTRNNGNCAIS